MNTQSQDQNVKTSARVNETKRRFKQSVDDVRYLLQNVADATEKEFERVFSSLEALPITTGEFSICTCRVGNARVMTGQAEFGAASYELRLLANWLNNHAGLNGNVSPSIAGKCDLLLSRLSMSRATGLETGLSMNIFM